MYAYVLYRFHVCMYGGRLANPTISTPSAHLPFIVLDIRLLLLLHFNITVTQKKYKKKKLSRLHPLSLVLIIFARVYMLYFTASFTFFTLVFDFATKLNLACGDMG